MPIYEYECEACGHTLEALQKISDDPLVECPACGEPSLKKLVSAAGFRLKGGGWYETDFKSGKKKNLAKEAKGEGKSGAADKSGSGTSTAKGAKDSKPAAGKKSDSGGS